MRHPAEFKPYRTTGSPAFLKKATTCLRKSQWDARYFNAGRLHENRTINSHRIDALFHQTEIMVNNFSFNRHEIAEAIIRDSFRRCIILHIMLEYIHYWGEKAEEWRIDGRNEMSTRLCKEISKDQNFKDLYRFYMDDGEFDKYNPGFKEVAILFVEETKRMHKTLLQTFATLLFELFTMFSITELMLVSDKLSGQYGEN